MLSMAAAVFFTSNVSAQRHIDWSVEGILTPPSEIRQKGYQQGSTITYQAVFKNNGTDTAKVGDSIFYRIEIPISQSQAILIPGPNQSNYLSRVLTADLAPGDTISISGSNDVNLYPNSVSNNINFTVVSLLLNRGDADSIAMEDNSKMGNNTLTEQLVWYVWQGWGVGVNNIEAAQSFAVYPNPSNGIVNINTPFINSDNSSNQINVLDINGQVVYSTELNVLTNIQQIDLSNLNNGIYFIQYSNGVSTETVKVSIIK